MNTPKSRDNELVVQELGKEVLIYDLNNHKAYCLNETSAIIWKLCDGKTSVGQMSLLSAGQLNKPISEDMIWLALDDFKQNNLLADNKSVRIEFNGLSRREVIKKAALASMVALPIIIGIIAPRAIHAASRTCGGTVASGTSPSARVDPGTTCAGVSDAQRSANCNASFGNLCQSCQAEYRAGNCFDNFPAPGSSAYNCFCV